MVLTVEFSQRGWSATISPAACRFGQRLGHEVARIGEVVLSCLRAVVQSLLDCARQPVQHGRRFREPQAHRPWHRRILRYRLVVLVAGVDYFRHGRLERGGDDVAARNELQRTQQRRAVRHKLIVHLVGGRAIVVPRPGPECHVSGGNGIFSRAVLRVVEIIKIDHPTRLRVDDIVRASYELRVLRQLCRLLAAIAVDICGQAVAQAKSGWRGK